MKLQNDDKLDWQGCNKPVSSALFEPGSLQAFMETLVADEHAHVHELHITETHTELLGNCYEVKAKICHPRNSGYANLHNPLPPK